MFNLVIGIIAKSGAWGVLILMLAENLIPIIPSELILPLAGFQAANGQFHPAAAILAGTVGSVFGGLAWYGLGYRLGLDRLRRMTERHGRWLPITSQELHKSHGWFQRWGSLAVCVGRALPGVRGVICIPAGITRTPLLTFLVCSTIGAAIWSTLLVFSGYALQSNYEAVHQWMNPVADGFLLLCVAFYFLRVACYRSARQDFD